MPSTVVNGVRLFWESSGSADAPGGPLIMVHGSWGDHHNWGTVVPGLAQSFQVFTYDRRGHSQSERPSTPGSLAEDAADLAALISSLGIAPAHVVGNSGGAAVALRLACDRPDLFRSLTVHEPPLFGLLAGELAMQAPLAAIRERVRAVVDLLEASDPAAAARLFVETIAFGPGAWDRLPARAQQTFLFNAPTFLDEQRDPTGDRIDLTALSRFPHRALLSEGDTSPPFFPAVVSMLARALPQAQRHVFRGAGHVPHLSHPDAYIATITASAVRESSAERQRNAVEAS